MSARPATPRSATSLRAGRGVVAALAIVFLLVCGAGAAGFEVTLLVLPSYKVVEQSYDVHVSHDAETGVYTLSYDAHEVVRVWASGAGRPDQVERTIAKRTEEYIDLSPFGVGVHTIKSEVLESHPAQYEDLVVGDDGVVSADDLPAVDPEGPGLPAADDQDDIIEATPETLVRYEYLVLEGAEDQADSEITGAAGSVDESTDLGNEEAAGDPVLVASGMFTTGEIDLSLGAGEVPIIAERVHRSDLGLAGSLGSAWWLSLDTRIVFGESRGAAHVQAVGTSNVASILGADVRSLAAVYAASSGVIEGPLGAVRAQLAEARATFDALRQCKRTYHGDHREIVIDEIDRQLLIASRHVAEGELIVSRFESHHTNLVTSYGTSETGALGALHDAAALHQAVADQYRLHAERAETHAVRNNRFRPGPPGAPPMTIDEGRVAQSAREAGNDSVTLIGTNGVPHRFRYEGAASLSSDHTYPDGSVNYFPSGAELRPEKPTTDTLILTPGGEFVLTRKDGSRWVYGICGQLLRVEDRNRNRAEFHYDAGEQLCRITDSRGREIVLDRSPTGLLTGIHAPLGTSVGYTYDATGELASVTDPAGDTVRYQYDGSRVVRTIKPDGSFRDYSYLQVRGAGRVVMTTDEEGHAESFDFSSPDRTVHTNPSGITTVHHFDGEGRVIQRDHPGGGEFAGGLSESYLHNDAGDRTWFRATDGSEYHYSYDSRHNLLRILYPDGTDAVWTYTLLDLPSSYVDRRGLLTRYHYDTAGNLISVHHPDGTTDLFSYQPPGTPEAGAIATHSDRRGNVRTYLYDDRGFVRSISDSIGLVGRYHYDAMGRLVAEEDGVGNETAYTYTPDGLPETVVGPEGQFINYDYDKRKDLVRLEANGRVSTFAYDRRHLTTRATNALGETVTFEYREDGLMTRRTVSGADDVDQYTTEFRYDSRGQLQREIQTNIGAVTEYEYDAVGRVAAITGPEGNRTEIAYSFDDRVVGRTRYLEGRPIQEIYGYYPDGPLQQSTDPLGRSTTWEHDAGLRSMTRVDALWNRWESTLDPYGQVLSRTDPTGRRLLYEYDLRGRLLSVRNNLSTVATYRYDLADRLISFTDGEGNTTGYEYDGRGRCISVIRPDGATIGIRYNHDDTIASQTDETGRVTSYEYDAIGRMTARVDPGNPAMPPRRSEYTWSPLGILESESDPTQRTITYQHDPAGRILGYRDNSGAQTTYELDLSGTVTAVIDPTGRRIDSVHDDLGRLTDVLLSGERSVRYAYDDAGNLRFEFDGYNRPHEYIYDDLNRLQTEINRLGDSWHYTYDDAGRRASSIDPTGITAAIDYDAAGLISRISYGDGSFLHYQYDRTGAMVRAENQSDGLEFSYTPRGMLESVTAAGVTIHYAYDEAGRRTTLEDLFTGRRTSYSYDDGGLLAGIDDSLAGFTSVNYDLAGRPTQIAAPNGVVTSTRYDTAGRTAATVVTNHLLAESVIDGQAHVYDAAGRRLYDIDHLGGITGYEYDHQGRLLQVQYPFSGPKRVADYSTFVGIGIVAQAPPGLTRGEDYDPGPADAQPGGTAYQSYLTLPAGAATLIENAYRLIHPLQKGSVATNQQMWTERFGYDAAGNRSVWQNGWGEVGYTYDSAGRLERVGGAAYDYDVAGNLTSASTTTGITTFAYTAGSRLAGAQTAGAQITYTYDPLGRRSGRTATTAVTPQHDAGVPTDLSKAPAGDIHRTVYQYDAFGFSILARDELDYAEGGDFSSLVKDQSHDDGRYRPVMNSGWNPGMNARAHTHYDEVAVPAAPITGGIPRTMAVRGPSGTAILSHDTLGSVRVVTNEHGMPELAYRFDAFGSTLAGAPGQRQPYGFNAKPVDPATGLYDFGYRDYSPTTARFTTPDPIRDGPNWYAYAANDPVNQVDPLGLAPRNATEAQRAAYKAHVAVYGDSATTLPTYQNGPREGQEWDCADLATYIASGAMDAATGATDYYTNMTAAGAPLSTIPPIHSTDFGHDGNVTFYRSADGTIDNTFNSPNVEAGTIGVFSNHVITVTADRAHPTDPIQTIQGHGTRDASWDAIGDQLDLDDYLGEFVGWAEIESTLLGSDSKGR
jgi:RHS repeat-associated protein